MVHALRGLTREELNRRAIELQLATANDFLCQTNRVNAGPTRANRLRITAVQAGIRIQASLYRDPPRLVDSGSRLSHGRIAFHRDFDRLVHRDRRAIRRRERRREPFYLLCPTRGIHRANHAHRKQ